MSTIYAGIDPGMTGALVALFDPIEMWVPPMIGDKIDWAGYGDLFDRLNCCFVGLEEVHSVPMSGAKSNFTFGGMYFSALCLLHVKRIKHDLIPPKKWQGEIWTTTDKVYVGGKIDTKSTSLLAAKRLFPDLDLRYGHNEQNTGKRKKAHSGIVDALLIAEYMRRKK